MHGDAVFLCPMKTRNLSTTTKGKTMIPEVFFFYNGFSGPHKCISKKTASNHGEKVFHYADLSLGYVGISHYMSGLYCFKLDHFQTRAESIYFLITSPHISTFQPRLPIFIFAIASPNFQPVAVIYQYSECPTFSAYACNSKMNNCNNT